VSSFSASWPPFGLPLETGGISEHPGRKEARDRPVIGAKRDAHACTRMHVSECLVTHGTGCRKRKDGIKIPGSSGRRFSEADRIVSLYGFKTASLKNVTRRHHVPTYWGSTLDAMLEIKPERKQSLVKVSVYRQCTRHVSSSALDNDHLIGYVLFSTFLTR